MPEKLTQLVSILDAIQRLWAGGSIVEGPPCSLNCVICAFYQCAFVKGINTNNKRGLRKVVENAGLSWQEAKKRIGDPEGAKMLERNRLALLDAGIWGTPSFRLLDSNGAQILALWGQDRLWRVADEIQQQFTKMI